jgi:phage/plasmid-associated DNA primase
VRKWLALIFQKPNEVHTAVILIGSEGVGKNFFAEMIGKLLGPHFAPLNSLQDIAVGGRFTFHLINSTLVHVSECESSDKGDIARIRNMITGKQIPFEAKNKNPITKDNTLHFIFSTNSCLPMKISADDRRFVVLPVSDACKGNRKFFASIDKALLSFYRNHIKAPTRDTKEKKFLLDLSKREKMRLKYFIFEKKHSVVDPIS